MSKDRVLRRVMHERRKALTILGLLLLVNVAVYGAVVIPLARRVANVEGRDRDADRLLQAARADRDRATNTLKSQELVSRDLAHFYNEVLPQNYSDARRMTYLRLQQVAAESRLEFEDYTSGEPEQEKDSSLTRVDIELVLRGTYDAVRTFIYTLDTSPEFVVIDDIGLAEGSDSGLLVLTLKLSTYFRAASQ